MMGACLFDWYEEGKNLLQRYCESPSSVTRGDETVLLSGYLASQQRMLIPLSAVPEAGVRCRDAFTGEEVFLMDMALSRLPLGSPAAMGTRTTPLIGYCMGAGAGLPIDLDEKSLEALRKYQRDADQLPRESPCGISLLIARSCFGGGFGSSWLVGYPDTEAKPKRRRPHRSRR
jgi:hypothetical protein